MSVLCCRVPDFLINLTLRRHPDWSDRPLALLSHDERICAVSNEARTDGVRLQMRPRQAEMRCPDLLLHPPLQLGGGGCRRVGHQGQRT